MVDRADSRRVEKRMAVNYTKVLSKRVEGEVAAVDSNLKVADNNQRGAYKRATRTTDSSCCCYSRSSRGLWA